MGMVTSPHVSRASLSHPRAQCSVSRQHVLNKNPAKDAVLPRKSTPALHRPTTKMQYKTPARPPPKDWRSKNETEIQIYSRKK